MAITASVALADTTLLSGQIAAATLTVSNSGGSDVVVTGIAPKVTPSAGAYALGACPFGGPVSAVVAASGSRDFYFNVLAHAPQVSNPNVSPATLDYVIGAVVYTNDGSITDASTATLTSSPDLEGS